MQGSAYILDSVSAVQRVAIMEKDRDGFVWVRTLDTATREVLRLAPSEVFESAYLAGLRQGGTPGKHTFRDIADFAEAAQSWKEARWNHADASYFGIHRIREMRAYWLGRLRAVRMSDQYTTPRSY